MELRKEKENVIHKIQFNSAQKTIANGKVNLRSDTVIPMNNHFSRYRVVPGAKQVIVERVFILFIEGIFDRVPENRGTGNS